MNTVNIFETNLRALFDVNSTGFSTGEIADRHYVQQEAQEYQINYPNSGTFLNLFNENIISFGEGVTEIEKLS